MKKSLVSLIIALVMIFSLIGAAAAKENSFTTCTGDSIQGTVIGVDMETGTVTVQTESGDECIVELKSDDSYDHPIVSLFNAYFGGGGIGSLSEALDNTQGYAIFDEGTGDLVWAEEGETGALLIKILSVTKNTDGTYVIELIVDGEVVPVLLTSSDGTLADDLIASLDVLGVDWDLLSGEDGSVIVKGVGDDVAAYHDEGIGFGKLVKLYAIAGESMEACEEEGEEDCAVSVDELLTFLGEKGHGMGHLFKEFGKPSMLGVGHIKQVLNDKEKGKSEEAKNNAPGQQKEKKEKKVKPEKPEKTRKTAKR